MIIRCDDHTSSIYTLMCDEHVPTEYGITITSSYVGQVKIILWILHASKKVTVKISADHPNTEIDLEIYVKAEHNAQHHLRVFQNHKASHTTSTCMIKGIAYDTSIIDYQGLITLEKESINAHAEQKSRFLIMSETATIKSVPSLQVYHNQVQCGHATTISYIDPIIIWYAAQRGINTFVIEQLVEDVFFN